MVFLQILKVIGIILLALLLLILILLVSPIKYKISGYYKNNNNDYLANGELTYFFNVFSAGFTFDKEINYYAKLFGFKFLDSNKKKTKKSNINKKNKDKKKKREDSNSSLERPEEESWNNKVFLKKAKKYISVLKSERFKKAFNESKDLIFKEFKILLPGKWHINGIVGFDDPSVTGEVLGGIYMFYAVFYKHIDIKGDFNNNIIDLDAFFKGRITILRLLWAFIALYFSKSIRIMIDCFKEEKNGGQ